MRTASSRYCSATLVLGTPLRLAWAISRRRVAGCSRREKCSRCSTMQHIVAQQPKTLTKAARWARLRWPGADPERVPHTGRRRRPLVAIRPRATDRSYYGPEDATRPATEWLDAGTRFSYQRSEMAHLLKTSTQGEIMWLLQLGWSHRRIARELKLDRGAVSRYARSALPSAIADREPCLSCCEEHDPHVEQPRPLACVLLLHARLEMAAEAGSSADCRSGKETGHTRSSGERYAASRPSFKFRSRLPGCQ